ncbi:MAG: FHA domain-containing protein [Polaromonas sp.]
MPQLIASVDGVEVKHVYLKNDRTTLGRKRHNDIVLDSMVVSGEHCVFLLSGIADVTLEDLGSTNGTYVNSHIIKAPQQLRDADIITIGNFSVQFFAASEHKPASTPPETAVMSLVALGLPGTSGERQACLKLLTGTSTGLEVPLIKAVTTFGQAGVAVVAVSHRRDGYYVAHMGGKTTPTLNGKPVGAEALVLAHNDVLNLAGNEMEFLLKAQ